MHVKFLVQQRKYKEMSSAAVSVCNIFGKQRKVGNYTTPLIKTFSSANRLSA